jgi:hypothetical protein
MTAPFDPFSQPWRGPRRDELIRRYLERDNSAGEALALLTFSHRRTSSGPSSSSLIAAAPDDDDILGHIAAGPVEGLLGRHGSAVIDRVETSLRGVWQHQMPDEIWARVCAARVGRD